MQEKFIPKRKFVSLKERVDYLRQPGNINKEFVLFKRHIEDTCIKNGFIKLGSFLNSNRLGPVVSTIRDKYKFDLVHHLANQDILGLTEGCGCIYCKIHHHYSRYKRIHNYLKTRLHKINGSTISIPTTEVLVAAYEEKIAEIRETYLKARKLRKALLKQLKIPVYNETKKINRIKKSSS